MEGWVNEVGDDEQARPQYADSPSGESIQRKCCQSQSESLANEQNVRIRDEPIDWNKNGDDRREVIAKHRIGVLDQGTGKPAPVGRVPDDLVVDRQILIELIHRMALTDRHAAQRDDV